MILLPQSTKFNDSPFKCRAYTCMYNIVLEEMHKLIQEEFYKLSK